MNDIKATKWQHEINILHHILLLLSIIIFPQKMPCNYWWSPWKHKEVHFNSVSSIWMVLKVADTYL